MFLPDYLSEGVDQATLGNQPLAEMGTVVVMPAGELDLGHGPLTPHLVFWLLFALTAGVTAWQFRKGSLSHGYDKLLFSIAGLAGWVIFLLWVATDHDATQNNLNILWMMPLYLPLAFWLRGSATATWVKWFFRVCGGLLVLQLITFPVFPQSFHTADIPIMLSLLLRIAYWNWWEQKLLPKTQTA